MRTKTAFNESLQISRSSHLFHCNIFYFFLLVCTPRSFKSSAITVSVGMEACVDAGETENYMNQLLSKATPERVPSPEEQPITISYECNLPENSPIDHPNQIVTEELPLQRSGRIRRPPNWYGDRTKWTIKKTFEIWYSRVLMVGEIAVYFDYCFWISKHC